MSNRIYYFTGTGNTLDAAKRIAEKLGDTELVRITKDMDLTEDLGGFERIGVMAPTYMGGIPELVQEKLSKISFGKDTYIFTAATCGGMEAATNTRMRKAIEKSGAKVSASFVFNYPANNQTSYAPVSEEQAIASTRANESDLERAASVIRKKQNNGYKSNPAMELMIKASGLMWNPRPSDKEFTVSDACIGCETCAVVCPTGNISMKEGKPEWNHQCERCTACMQVCPKQAIQFGDKSKSWGRYINPNITVKELKIDDNH